MTKPAAAPDVQTGVQTSAPTNALPHDWNRGRARIGASLLLALTQGLGINMVNSNLQLIQGDLGATANAYAGIIVLF